VPPGFGQTPSATRVGISSVDLGGQVLIGRFAVLPSYVEIRRLGQKNYVGVAKLRATSGPDMKDLEKECHCDPVWVCVPFRK
jgi:hypothetical protein